MRNSIATSIASLILATSAAAHADAPAASTEASSSEQPKAWNAIHLNIGAALFGELSLGYERMMSSRVSLEVDAAGLHANGIDSNGQPDQLSVYFLGFRPHIYFVQDAPAGLYISPFVQVGRGTFASSSGTAAGNVYTAGATMGYSLVLGGFDLKLGLGLEDAKIDLTAKGSDGTTSSASGAGIGLTGDLSLGAVF